MAISKSRLFFRHFLITVLLFAFLFFATAAYFYTTTKRNPGKLAEISPVLHAIDVAHYQVRAYNADDDARYTIAQEMLEKSAYAKVYTGASIDILLPLSKKGHEPSTKLYNDILQNN
ncbi:MAG: hypothetical protein ACRBDL_09125 [Alphaproteobacteria bacterium]